MVENSIAVSFVAQLLQRRHSRLNNEPFPLRWECLSEEKKEKFMLDAIGIIVEWNDNEKIATRHRKQLYNELEIGIMKGGTIKTDEKTLCI